MIVIPAIDIYNDQIVRLKKGDFNQITYYDKTPLEQVKLYKSFGFNRIHIVDLAGSKDGKINIADTLNSIKRETGSMIEFGGGIRNIESVNQLIDLGVDKIIIGSLSIKNKPEFEKIISAHGSNKFIIATDVMNNMVAVSGWMETTATPLEEHIKYCLSLGVDTYLCTDISKDGMLSGLNFSLYENTMAEFPSINIIASGGVKDINDIKETAKRNLYGVVIGKAIYENKINLKELSEIGK
jgi:phosphoribosylformimino-5-aminoimidazole carboxamide ribotide isomerase